MIKLLLCSCNRCLLNRLDAKCTYSFLLDDCRYDEKHEILAARCALCLNNLVDFGRNYFAFIAWSCCHIAKNLVCGHCSSLGMN